MDNNRKIKDAMMKIVEGRERRGRPRREWLDGPVGMKWPPSQRAHNFVLPPRDNRNFVSRALYKALGLSNP